MAEEAIPLEFVCPITKEAMAEPVFTEDGQTYEREAIEEWFSTGRITSPATGLPLRSSALAPNIALKGAIDTYRKERPRAAAAARQVKDLRAALAECERRLHEANARAAASVPHAEYELLLKRYGRACDTASIGATTAPTSPESSPSHSGAEDDVVTAYRSALQRQAEQAEQASAQVALKEERLCEELRACEASAEADELAAAGEDLRAAVQREQVAALGEVLVEKEGERDAIGEQVLAHAEPLGLDGLAMLAAVRGSPTAAWRGPLSAAYAELHCECVALAGERNLALEGALAAERAGMELRVAAQAMNAKVACLRARLRKLDAPRLAADAEARAARDSIESLVDEDVKATAAWSERVWLQASGESLQKLAAVRGRCAASIRRFRSDKASKLKGEGRAACELKRAGFTVGELREASYSASELKEAGFTVGELKQGGFLASQAKEAGLALSQLREGGFAARELTEAGCMVEELAEAGFSAGELAELGLAPRKLLRLGFAVAQLREADFEAGQLKASGLTAGQLKDGGFQARRLREDGFAASELKEGGFTARELRVGGFVVSEVKDAGFTALQCRDAGYAAGELFPLCLPVEPRASVGRLVVCSGGVGRLEGSPCGNWYDCVLWSDYMDADEVRAMARAVQW